MFAAVVALTVALGPVQEPASAKIVGASLFKNGFAVVTREIDVPSSGRAALTEIPEASLGTLWFFGQGTRLRSVVTTQTETSRRVEVGTLLEIIAANVGKNVVLGVKNGDAVVGAAVAGKILSASGDVVVLSTTEQAGTLALPKSQITSIKEIGTSAGLIYSRDVKATSRALRFETAGAGKIRMVSLERGLTWAPAYAVDLMQGKKLSLTSKATVVNDLGTLDGIEAKFITGFPNVPYASYLEPLISGMNVSQLSSMLGGIGGPGAPPAPAGGMMSQNAMREGADFLYSMDVTGQAGAQREDLFFYSQPGVTMKKGDRAHFVLFSMQAPYEDLYTWSEPQRSLRSGVLTPVGGDSEVWHALLFENTSGQPLTTGPATAFKDGELIGQDLMTYVPAGARAELRINKALDVRVLSREAEVARERGAVKNRLGEPVMDRVTIEGTIEVTNGKPEAIKTRLRTEFAGTLGTSEGSPIVTKTLQGLTQMNPMTRLEWTQPVGAGKVLTLKYSYSTFVPSQG